MRIDSSTIGMESARRYQSSQTGFSRFSVKDEYGKTAHQSTDLFGNLFHSNDGEQLDARSQKNEEENAGDGMITRSQIIELRDRVELMRRWTLPTRIGMRTLDDFRQYTIRYIFTSVFRPKNTAAGAGMNSLYLEQGQYYEENEDTSFSTVGKVRTADGREIDIHVDIEMSRSFAQAISQEMEIMPINTCDPLVLNFDGNVADLSDQKFFFDIDADGEADEVSLLGSGSGYLALDKNGDGIINDGNELFGPQTGNGFNDLAAYDEDHNGWIDENDSIWSKLKIWCKNADGTDSLYTLADKGVGAICLQNAATDFSLNGAGNQTNGYIRSTGIFLYENGNVGTVQHLDVAK